MDTSWAWMTLGFLGQACFSARFVVQWLASERCRRSVLPTSFWYLSLGGGVTLLVYAVYLRDPVFIVGQASGLLIYGRNIWLTAPPGLRSTLRGRVPTHADVAT